jgi:hypothetical protein
MTPPQDESTHLTTSDTEAWVAHAALLDAYERAVDVGEDGSRYQRVLCRIENGNPLDRSGRQLLRAVLVEYLADAPLRDRAAARAVLRRTREYAGSPTPTGRLPRRWQTD